MGSSVDPRTRPGRFLGERRGADRSRNAVGLPRARVGGSGDQYA